MALEFHLGEFEGPLDLLLHLIARHKLNINDIEISVLLEQYLEYMAQMREADLEISSEFLEMAARLVYIKTVSLLPRPQEAAQLKQELEGQLLEYQSVKEAAALLGTAGGGGRFFARQPAPVQVDPTYTGVHPREQLLEAYLAAVGKAQRRLPPPASAFHEIVSRRVVSVTSRIVFVLRKLYRTGQMAYDEFFAASDKSELIATFLAMLELIKSRRIMVSEDNTMVYFTRERQTDPPAVPEGESQSE